MCVYTEVKTFSYRCWTRTLHKKPPLFHKTLDTDEQCCCFHYMIWLHSRGVDTNAQHKHCCTCRKQGRWRSFGLVNGCSSDPCLSLWSEGRGYSFQEWTVSLCPDDLMQIETFQKANTFVPSLIWEVNSGHFIIDCYRSPFWWILQCHLSCFFCCAWGNVNNSGISKHIETSFKPCVVHIPQWVCGVWYTDDYSSVIVTRPYW